MNTFLDRLLQATDPPGATPFSAVARYYPNMDFLLYVKEDCSFRAERVDAFLTVLWHPHEEKLVGLKLKGFQFVFNRTRAILELKGTNSFFPLVKALEIALTGGMAERMLANFESGKQLRAEELYAKATDLARGVTIPPGQLDMEELEKEAA